MMLGRLEVDGGVLQRTDGSCRETFLSFLWFEPKRGRMATEATVNWAIKDGKRANGEVLQCLGPLDTHRVHGVHGHGRWKF